MIQYEDRPPNPTIGSDRPAEELYTREYNAMNGSGAYWPTLPEESKDRYRIRAGCPNFRAIEQWKQDEHRRVNYALCTSIDTTSLHVALDRMEALGLISKRASKALLAQAHALRDTLCTVNDEAFERE